MENGGAIWKLAGKKLNNTDDTLKIIFVDSIPSMEAVHNYEFH